MNNESQGGPAINGRVTWKSPSNIAIVKYWGKHGEQLPSNPSMSLTLSEAHTVTSVDYNPGSGKIRFLFEGAEKPEFSARVEKYIHRLTSEMPKLGDLDLTINSENSFPHSAGIASSASAMSALALCLTTIADDEQYFKERIRKASNFARLGSGSACRSMEGPVVAWGKIEKIDGSSDLYGVPVAGMHEVFSSFRDSILIVDRSEKHVKSSAGHALMHGHPYAKQRFERARTQLERLVDAMRAGDIETFGEIAESEALDLHAMMMASTPSYILMKPGTLDILQRVRAFRKQTGTRLYFTLDAGPNVHLLYPEEDEPVVRNLITDELVHFCMDGLVIHDKVGNGAVQID